MGGAIRSVFSKGDMGADLKTTVWCMQRLCNDDVLDTLRDQREPVCMVQVRGARGYQSSGRTLQAAVRSCSVVSARCHARAKDVAVRNQGTPGVAPTQPQLKTRWATLGRKQQCLCQASEPLLTCPREQKGNYRGQSTAQV